MRELSLNILDIAQNSISAKSTFIEIEITESKTEDYLLIKITDNGYGMSPEQVEKATDPFYTTRSTRKIGLGIPFMKMAAEMTGGSFLIESKLGIGTRLKARFIRSHVDLMPLGNICDTICILVRMNPDIDFVYRYQFDVNSYKLDTRELREILEDMPLDSPEVMDWIKAYLTEQHERTYQKN